MTDINGLMRDPQDEDSLISSVSEQEVTELMEQGVISGGMLPKVKCCMDAIERGVQKVFIINGTLPHTRF